MSKIEIGKQYRTRDGRDVRIYAIEPKGMYPVHGAILTDGVWGSSNWVYSGCYYFDGKKEPEDLIEVVRRIKRDYWINIYQDEHFCGIYSQKHLADNGSNPDRIACVRVTIDCEEGEGL